MGLNKWCIFHKICPLFREKQFVCTHHGGSGEQCGKYREFVLKQSPEIEKLNQEINELSIKRTKIQDPIQQENIEKIIRIKIEQKSMFQKEDRIKKLMEVS